MKEILEEWLEFSKDVIASDFAGNEQLEILRNKTKEIIKTISIKTPLMTTEPNKDNQRLGEV